MRDRTIGVCVGYGITGVVVIEHGEIVAMDYIKGKGPNIGAGIVSQIKQFTYDFDVMSDDHVLVCKTYCEQHINEIDMIVGAYLTSSYCTEFVELSDNTVPANVSESQILNTIDDFELFNEKPYGVLLNAANIAFRSIEIEEEYEDNTDGDLQ